MNFSYDSVTLFRKVEPRLPTLKWALGQYVMEFDVIFSPTNPPKGAVVIDDLHASVSFGDSRSDLGVARPAPSGGAGGILAIRHLEHGHHDTNIRFRMYLSGLSLEAMETARNGADAVFHLNILGRMTGYDIDGIEPPHKQQEIAWRAHVLLCAPPAQVYSPQVGSHETVLTVPQSAWTTILAGAGFSKAILLEIPILESDELGPAFNHIKEAQTAFLQGRYADTVDRCRDALDAMIPEPNVPWFHASTSEKRKNLAVEESFRLSWGAVRQITHATHHRNNLKSDFTRPMAQYVLSAASLALSLASREKDLFTVSKGNSPTTTPSDES